MKAHKYWSIGALITMICTFLTGHMNKMIHTGLGLIALICMIMSVYSGHKMISRKNQFSQQHNGCWLFICYKQYGNR